MSTVIKYRLYGAWIDNPVDMGYNVYSEVRSMDQIKTGRLIRELRIKKGLTQKQLAGLINVSDKAVSKWENANGFPDLSLLGTLAEVFGVDVQVLMKGEIDKNESEKGDMKKIRFYVCRECGNIITATSEAAVSCCGNKLQPLVPRKAEESEKLSVEDIGGELHISSGHPMTKQHYISFAAYVNDDRAMIFKQYPEWGMQFDLPLYRSGRLVWYCTECGLLYQRLV